MGKDRDAPYGRSLSENSLTYRQETRAQQTADKRHTSELFLGTSCWRVLHLLPATSQCQNCTSICNGYNNHGKRRSAAKNDASSPLTDARAIQALRPSDAIN